MLTLAFVDSYLAVIDHGGIREAARAKGLSQAAVSQHVRKLEAELGVPLLHRSHAACTPTRHGNSFMPLARSLVALAQRACTMFEPQRLRIGASSNIGVYFLPGLLRRYENRQSPEAQIEVTVDSNPQLISQIKAGLLDVALTEWWDDDPCFSSAIWHREPLVVILPPDHPLAPQRQISVAELSHYPLIAGESGTGTALLLRQHFGDAALPKPRLVLGSTEAVKQAVMNGLGVSIVLAGAVRREAANGELLVRPLATGNLAKHFHVSTPANLPDRCASNDFLHFIRTQGDAHA